VFDVTLDNQEKYLCPDLWYKIYSDCCNLAHESTLVRRLLQVYCHCRACLFAVDS
jgi:hypothetical protein